MKRTGIVPIVLLVGVLVVVFVRPRWYLNLTKRVEVSPEVGAALVVRYECRRCHVLAGQGALKAPDLDDAIRRLDEATLYRWLADPRSLRPDTAMPNLRLSDSEIAAIIAYLQTLR